jgi:hypothetical protein
MILILNGSGPPHSGTVFDVFYKISEGSWTHFGEAVKVNHTEVDSTYAQ